MIAGILMEMYEDDDDRDEDNNDDFGDNFSVKRNRNHHHDHQNLMSACFHMGNTSGSFCSFSTTSGRGKSILRSAGLNTLFKHCRRKMSKLLFGCLVGMKLSLFSVIWYVKYMINTELQISIQRLSSCHTFNFQ